MIDPVEDIVAEAAAKSTSKDCVVELSPWVSVPFMVSVPSMVCVLVLFWVSEAPLLIVRLLICAISKVNETSWAIITLSPVVGIAPQDQVVGEFQSAWSCEVQSAAWARVLSDRKSVRAVSGRRIFFTIGKRVLVFG